MLPVVVTLPSKSSVPVPLPVMLTLALPTFRELMVSLPSWVLNAKFVMVVVPLL